MKNLLTIIFILLSLSCFSQKYITAKYKGRPLNFYDTIYVNMYDTVKLDFEKDLNTRICFKILGSMSQIMGNRPSFCTLNYNIETKYSYIFNVVNYGIGRGFFYVNDETGKEYYKLQFRINPITSIENPIIIEEQEKLIYILSNHVHIYQKGNIRYKKFIP